MQRAKQTKFNILISLLHQLVTAVCGLVLPRFILSNYGSEVNGVIQSISQLLGYTILFEGGIGGVIRASLYKPIADNDEEAISDIFNNTKRFFYKMSLIFVVVAFVLCFGIKLIISTEFSALYVGTLTLILGLNTYFSYYFGISQEILMKADQKLYIVQFVQSITLVLNLILCIIAIESGLGIHAVKFITAAVFLLNPLVYKIYVKHHYKISKTLYDSRSTLRGKSDALIHHIAYFIHRNTDIVIISAFCGVKSASVYSVYNAVIIMTENLLNSISAGLSAAMGNMLARDEKEALSNSFEIYESVNTALTMAIATVTAILIVPFVTIYTSGINDVNYIEPVFAYMMIGAGAMYCLRMPYGTVVGSAGHYKETRFGAVCEMVINLGISLVLAKPFGIAGVAAATLLAMAYRTFYLVWYLSKNIIKRPITKHLKSLFLNLLVCVGAVLIFNEYVTISAKNLIEFLVEAIRVSLIIFPVFALLNWILNRNVFKFLKFRVKKVRRKR